MAWHDNPIVRNFDGTAYTVKESVTSFPYEVVPLDVDPLNKYNFSEVAAYWHSLPDGDPNKQQAGEIPGPPAPTPTERITMYEAAVFSRLDTFVQTRLYPDATTCATYIASNNMQKYLEARTLVDLRDQTMDTWFTLRAGYEADTSTVPETWAEVEAQLPALAWPSDYVEADGDIRAKAAVLAQTSKDADNKFITGTDGLGFVA